MSYLFAVPAQYQALLEAGQLVRRGALLINANGGGIVAHLQETSGFARSGMSALNALGGANPIGAASQLGNLAASGIVIRQNRQIKQGITEIQGMLDLMQGVGVANLATSLIGIGVTVAAAALMVQRIERLRTDLEELARTLTDFRDEWRIDELEKLLQSASTELSRVEGVRRRVNGRAVLEAAERDLHHVFDEMARRGDKLLKRQEIPVDALRIVLEGLSLSGSARIKALFLMDEAEEAKACAQSQIKTLTRMTVDMPADRLANHIIGTSSPAEAAATTSAQLALMRENIVGIAPLVNELRRQDLRPSVYLSSAEQETDKPLMFLASQAT